MAAVFPRREWGEEYAFRFRMTWTFVQAGMALCQRYSGFSPGSSDAGMASTYRLVRETSVVVTTDGQPEILTIPAGSIIAVHEPPSRETGLVAVNWESMKVRMFAVDLERRAELVKEAAG